MAPSWSRSLDRQPRLAAIAHNKQLVRTADWILGFIFEPCDIARGRADNSQGRRAGPRRDLTGYVNLGVNHIQSDSCPNQAHLAVKILARHEGSVKMTLATGYLGRHDERQFEG